MPFIIMWKFGTRQCLLVLNGEQISVRLIEGISVLREVRVISPEAALCTAEMWEVEEQSELRAVLRSTSFAVSASPIGITHLTA